MLSVYDLYDLHAIFVNVRYKADYEWNEAILLKVIEVLNNRQNSTEMNQFRLSLSNISSLKESEIYQFVFYNNVYTYFPAVLKDEFIYNVLFESCNCLLRAVREGNKEKVEDLADCLHNLPTDIVKNNFRIPKYFWNREVKYYRKKWDKDFLLLNE